MSFTPSSPYSETTIDPSGSDYTSIVGVDSAGDIAGYYEVGGGVVNFIDKAGVITDIAPPAGADYAEITGIDAAGDAFGVYGLNVEGDPGHEFVDTNGVVTTINLPEVLNVVGRDAAGDIVGNYVAFGDNGSHDSGFIDKAGVITTISGSTNAEYTDVTGVDAAGDIVGTYVDNSGSQHGFIDKAGVIKTINGSPSAYSTTVAGFDAAGDIVGYYYDDTGEHGFVDKAGVIAPFDPVAGAADTQVLGIDAAGDAYGTYSDPITGAFRFFVDKSGAITTFDAPLAYEGQTFVGADAAGDIAGDFETGTGYPFIGIDRAGVSTAINNGPDVVQTIISGIDAAGDVVGTTELTTGVTVGFVYRLAAAPTAPSLSLAPFGTSLAPTISGTADNGDTITLYDGTTSIGTVEADANTGAFTFTNLAALSAGEHSLTATATNSFGQTSAASSPLVIEVGTAATIAGELDALETKAGLAAIVITDARLLPVASVAAMNHLMTADAAALAAIQGGYSFGITTVTSSSTVTVIYDPTGLHTFTSTTKLDGSTTLDSFNASGTLTREATTYADKSQDITKYGITGQSYTTEQDIYNSAGVLTSQIRTHADGSSASSYVLNPDGSSVLDYFNASGILTRQGITYADKSQDITKYSGTSPNLVTEHDVINAQGTQSLVDQTQPNGSHVEYIYTPNQTLTSNKGVSDAFDNFSAGSTTFVFNPAFGQDVISGFHAGAGANHDVIQIGSATLNQFSDLVGLMTPSGAGGADTLITIDPTDTILLKHVAKASLTAQNFGFTHIA